MALSSPEAPSVLEGLRQDVRFAWRGLRRHRSFAVVAASTLAVGIAAATTVLGVVDGVLLRHPPVLEPERMVSIWEFRSEEAFESMEGRLIAYDRYEAYRDATTEVFDGLAAHSYAHLSIQTGDGAMAVDGFLTSGNYFTVLGLPPELGGLYRDDHEPTVVISERLWRTRFGADPAVVGRTITVDSRTFTLGGVVRRGFVGTMSTFTGDVWIPAVAYTELGDGDEEDSYALPTRSSRPSLVVPIGRIRAGLDREQATERINALAPLLRAEEDARLGIRGARLDGITWRTDIARIVNLGLGTLLGAAGMLLLVACANIAGLVLARSYDRSREVAVRLAIGAGRLRIIRQMVTENLLLFMIGGAGGVLLARVASQAMSSIQVPLNATITLDTTAQPRVLAVGLGLAAVLGVLFGLAPARRASGVDLSTALKEAGQPAGRSRTRGSFVVGQVAVATLLLIVAGLSTRSLLRVLEVNLGFDPDGVLVATLDIESHGYDEDRGRAFYGELLERVRAVPGVEGASLAEFVMLGGAAASNGARAVGGEDPPSLGVYRNVVDPAYAEVNRVELLSGRFIGEQDRADTPPVAVVNRTLAEQMWPGQDPIGRRFESGGRTYEVVGVAANGAYAFTYEDPKRFAYYAYTQRYRPGMSLHVRAADLEAAAERIRAIVRDLDPNIALQGVRTMNEVVTSNRFLPRSLASLTSAFALTGLFLAALGVYGMLSVYVARRRREFGIRLALGARPRQVMGLVVAQGAGLALAGCALGLIGAFGTTRLLSTVLYGIEPFDPVTFVVVPVLLIATAVVASVRPARTATRVDPRTALQES